MTCTMTVLLMIVEVVLFAQCASKEFLPAPPGQSPKCSNGRTFCEAIDNYPSDLIASLVLKSGQVNYRQFLVDETKDEFINTDIRSVSAGEFFQPAKPRSIAQGLFDSMGKFKHLLDAIENDIENKDTYVEFCWVCFTPAPGVPARSSKSGKRKCCKLFLSILNGNRKPVDLNFKAPFLQNILTSTIVSAIDRAMSKAIAIVYLVTRWRCILQIRQVSNNPVNTISHSLYPNLK
ncbi:uncharacterized protein LOC132696398 [Cylas formicarius]|uniref:uncharacterized protein LOC132696398 n=1 Tax=Cylas formicarius TaxID=197179 RepID=UPI00295874AD|nr:uncharacterized protein LOC132696398 [Cylas formicarius]